MVLLIVIYSCYLHTTSIHATSPTTAITSTVMPKVDEEEAFKAGIKYRPPHLLVKTSGENWVFQPHPEPYETIATNVLDHYAHYKKDEIDETCILTYFYVGGTGT